MMTFSHLALQLQVTVMEIVTHLINDTIEFYKWTLTIAGKWSNALNAHIVVCETAVQTS